jgi:predicted XRE-type DNA-binding protein
LFKGKQGLAKEKEPIPIDVREKRASIEIKDITMDDVTNKLHKKPQSVEPSKDGANQLQKMWNQIWQSKISLGLGETEVVDSILRTPVTLSFGEILGTSRELADKLSDMIERKNVKQPQVSSVMHIPRDRARLLRLLMKCGENYISAIIDTGSMLNVVKREVYQKCIKLPMDPARTLTMNDANGGASQLVGLVANVPLSCGSVETTANLFIGDRLPFDLLLGCPWQRGNFISIDERVDGTYVVFKNPTKEGPYQEMLVQTEETNLDLGINTTSIKEVEDNVLCTMESKNSDICPNFTKEMPKEDLANLNLDLPNMPCTYLEDVNNFENIRDKSQIGALHNLAKNVQQLQNRVWPYSDNGPIIHLSTYLEINEKYNRHGLKSIQLHPEKGYNAWEYSSTLIQVASFGIYIMGFFTSLLSTIQRTINNIYLKEVEASKLITYNNTQPLTHSESTMPGQVTEPNLSATYPPPPPLPPFLLPNDIPLLPSIPHSHSFDTDTQRDGHMTLLQEYVNQVNYNGLATHPVIVTAPFGIRFNLIQQHGQEYEQNILFNASIMHIDPQHNILANRTGHIVLTFIFNTIEPALTNDLLQPTEPNVTSEPSPTQANPDNDLNLLYLTPPLSPASSSIDHHDGTNNGPGMLNDILSKQPDTINTTSPVVDDQFNYLYPKPPLSSLTDQPD